MPTNEWLRKEFSYGYDSGNLDSLGIDEITQKEEKYIGGSYKVIANRLLRKYIKPKYQVLELGPGKGSWSRVILDVLGRQGVLTTLDFQDVSEWLKAGKSESSKLITHQVDSNDYDFLSNNTYDLFWSFGVLCHNNLNTIYEIIHNIYPKMKTGGLLIHQYADWDKLELFGWKKGGVPEDFKSKTDDKIWWPRNNQKIMQTILEANGFEVLDIDCNLVERDSIFKAIKI